MARSEPKATEVASEFVPDAGDEIVMESPEGWEWETVAEESAVIVKMELGDEFIGQYKGEETVTPDDGKTKPFQQFIFRGRNGTRYAFGDLYHLRKALERVKPDAWCRITRMEDIPTALNPMQNFRVDIRK